MSDTHHSVASIEGTGLPPDLRRTLQRLQDIEEIKRLEYRYFRCLDTCNLQELEQLLTEDLTTDFHGGTYRLQLTSRAQYLELIANTFNSQFIGHHNVHHPEIDLLSDTEAQGTWYLTDVAMNLATRVCTHGTALRRERYVKLQGQWKISHASYERIYEVEEAIERLPRLTAHYLGVHGAR